MVLSVCYSVSRIGESKHHRHCRLPVGRLRVTGKNPYNYIMVLSVCYSVCPIGGSKQYEMKMFTPLRRSYAFVVVCLFVRYSDSFVPSVSRITHERVYGRRPNNLGVGGGMAEWLLVSNLASPDWDRVVVGSNPGVVRSDGQWWNL